MITKLTFKVESETETEIKKYCQENNIPTVSDFCRQAVSDLLNKKNTGGKEITVTLILKKE